VDRERGSLCPSGSHPWAGVPNGDGPAPIIGVELRDVRRGKGRHPVNRRRDDRRCSWLTTSLALCSVVLVGAIVAPGAASAAPRAATTSTTSTPDPTVPAPVSAATSSAASPLRLISQSAWVTPGQPFDLKLQTAAGGPPTSQTGVSVSVYPCLSSVSGFDQSVMSSGGPEGTPISATRTPLAVSGLPPLAGGGFDLSLPVSGRASSTAPAGGFTIALTSAGGQCQSYPYGVYPVRIQLVDTSTGQDLGGFTTHMTYVDEGADTQRLRFALVLPVESAVTPSVSPTAAQLLARPSSALAPLGPRAATVMADLATTLASPAHATVPVTLEASPQTVQALDASGHGTTVDQLASLAATPDVHQFLSAPFAPVDASTLVDDGLGDELALQISRGAQVLGATAVRPSASAGSGLGAWVTNDALDSATLAQLASDGYHQVVLPSSSVPASPTNGSAAEPFPLATTQGGTVTGLATDADLEARFDGSPQDPVLAAYQLVAELAQIYFEKPNDTTVRGVAAVAPNGWAANPAFVGALLSALDGNPVIDPVTTADLFATLPMAGCHGSCKLVPAGPGAPLPAGAIRAQRRRIAGFSSAATAAAARLISTQLGDLVLVGESERLRPDQQAAVLANTGSALDAQLAQLVVGGERTVTLTSQQGTLQVTMVSSAPYPVTGTLTLTSDKLLFPNGTTQWSEGATLFPGGPGSAHTTVVPVIVRTRASGLFRVGIAFASPDRGLVLSTGQVSVRSTATSVVGIVLSLGAVLVLVVWWLRTSRRRRALRRLDEADDLELPVGTP
jgi:hypothetical protein